MNKKEYIEKLKNLIVQRVKFHAPRLNGNDIDFSLLDVIGIDAKYPIFLLKKPLNKIFYSAFKEAKKEISFNLILLEKPQISQRKLSLLDKTYLLLKEEIGCNLLQTLETLNINYLSRSNFENEYKEEFIKINGQNINFEYLPYFYRKKLMFNRVEIDVKQFLLNGKNSLINLVNTSNLCQKIDVEINIPLPRGYYSFKQSSNCIEIKNLFSQEKAYFNYNTKEYKVQFSNMSGVESCTFACINLSCQLKMLPKQKKALYFNFGENKFCISNHLLMEYFFNLSQNKMNEIFDVKVHTKNINFDNDFNLYLPQKIWEKWQKYDVDEENINLWLKTRAKIVKSTEKGLQIINDFYKIKEVLFFRNSKWKRVFVLHNNSNYLFADNVKYFNYNLLTKEIFDKNNEIYLSFAE